MKRRSKMRLWALLGLTLAQVASADTGSLVGRWRTVSESCELSGPYINGYLAQTTYIKTIVFFAYGTFSGEQRSPDNNVNISFEGTYQVNGEMLIEKATEVSVNGASQSAGEATTARFKISNSHNLLILSHQITEPDKACPVGDNAVTVLSRIYEPADDGRAQIQSYTGGHLATEIEQVRVLAQSSKSCTIASLKYDGFGVCITGSPSMLKAEVECDGGKSVVIALEDPYYYSCPPAKLINPNLGNSAVSEIHKKAWDALQTSAQTLRVPPYRLFRMELIQTLKEGGLELKTTRTKGIRSELNGADLLSTFER